MTENNSTHHVDIDTLNKLISDQLQMNGEKNDCIQFDQKTNESNCEEHVALFNYSNQSENGLTTNDYIRSLHNTTTSSGYGTSFFTSSNDNSLINPNESILSTPRTPKTPTMFNSNTTGLQLGNSFDIQIDDQNINQYQKLINNDFMARMGINLPNPNLTYMNNESFAKKSSIENGINKSFVRQSNQIGNLPNKNSTDYNQNEIRYDNFSGINLNEMPSHLNSLMKNTHVENSFSSLNNQTNFFGNKVKQAENKIPMRHLDYHESSPSTESNCSRLLNSSKISMDINHAGFNFNNNYQSSRYHNSAPPNLDLDSFNLNSPINKNHKTTAYAPQSINNSKMDRCSSTNYSVNGGHLAFQINPNNNYEEELSNCSINQDNDCEDDDDVFTGNLSSCLNNATDTWYKINSNLNEKNVLNNGLCKGNDSFENRFNSIQNSNLNESKPRHQSLSNNKFLQNFNTSPNLSNLQSFNEFNAKKRANSFGFTMPSISSYQSSATNRFNNSQNISNMQIPQQLNSYTHNNNVNNNSFYNSFGQNNSSTSISSDSVMQNYLSLQSEIASNKPLRSERLPSQLIDDIVKQAKTRRKSGGKKEVCVFCRNNGEKEQFYTSHTLKDAANRISCPILRLYKCPICHATDDNAHTIKYCPSAEKETGPIKLYKDSRMNTAVLLMNALSNNAAASSASSSSLHSAINQSPLNNFNIKNMSYNVTSPVSNKNGYNNMSYSSQNSNSVMF